MDIIVGILAGVGVVVIGLFVVVGFTTVMDKLIK